MDIHQNPKKSIKKDTTQVTDIICPDCGQVHEGINGLLDCLYCSNCQKNLCKEIF